MAVNTSPIFSVAPRISWNSGTGITAANTNMDGTGTVTTIFTAGTNGSFVQKIIARAQGTNVASVARIFINNGSSNTSAANNVLVGELSFPATTASNSTQQPDFALPLNIGLPPGYVINITLGTAVSAGWVFSAVGGDY